MTALLQQIADFPIGDSFFSEDMAAAAVSGIVEAWGCTDDPSRHALCRKAAGPLSGVDPVEVAEIASWQTFFGRRPTVEALDAALFTRSYLVGNRLTLADVVAYLACCDAVAKGSSVAAKRWLQQVQVETHKLAPDAKLPAVVDLKLPANLPGPVPLPKEAPPKKETVKKDDKKKEDDKKKDAAVKTDEKKDAPKQQQQPKKEKKKKEPAAAPAAEDEAGIFAAMDVRVGVIVDAWEHPEAEKLFCEKIDCGDKEPRTIASGLRAFYEVADLKDRKVLVFANLKPRTMSGFKSEGMVLCASSADHTVVKFLEVPADAVPGTRVSLDGVDNKDTASGGQVQKKKLLEKLLPSLRTNAEGVACCNGKPFTLPQGPVKAPLPDAAIG